MVNLYHILQLEAGADVNSVKRAFRQLAKKYHPDVNPSALANEQFHQIFMAYEILGDEQKKKLYDNLLQGSNEPELQIDDYEEERVGEWRRKAYQAAHSYGNMSYADFRRNKIILHMWSKYLVLEWLVSLSFGILFSLGIIAITNAFPYEGTKEVLQAKERLMGFGFAITFACAFILGNFIKIQINNFQIMRD